MRNLVIFSALALILASCAPKSEETDYVSNDKFIIAYVTSWTTNIPEPGEVTHINYAFAHVNDSFDGIKIDNEERLHKIVELRELQPDLKILLSIGGWGSDRFSEMAANDDTRLKFAADCKRVVDEFKLDGIDIDWEYPTSDLAKISASPDDWFTFSQLMIDIREAIGDEKLLTLATASNGKYYDFKAFIDYVDFVNIMSYDMGWPPYHNAGLYPSEHTQYSGDECVKAHVDSGVPIEKLVFGIPFYGHFSRDMQFQFFSDTSFFKTFFDNTEKKWDDIAHVPYLVNDSNKIVYVYDDSLSVSIKCKYIIEKNMLGAMYWEYASDRDGSLLRSVRNEFYPESGEQQLQ